MKIIIISATAFEVAKVFIKSSKNIGINFITTGIGILPTAVNLTKIIYEQQPNLILQAGIAGCFNTSVALGTTMLVEQEFLGDLGVTENEQWKDIFDLKLIQPNTTPFKKKGLINASIKAYDNLNLPVVNAVTVNQISTNQQHINQLIKKYKPTLESMEGAALHYVCNSFKIPYLQIRAVSNYIGERDEKKWEIALAIDNLNKVIEEVVSM